MSILDSLSEWWKAEQKNWTLERVAAPAVAKVADALPEGQPLPLHQCYATVRMRSMAIGASRAGWNLFHAVLHCEASLGLRNGETALIQAVLSPDFLRDLDAKRLQQVLHIDRAVFGPMPYVGGPLSLNMGVFAVNHGDLAAPFLSVLEDLATTAGVAFVGAATPFVAPIKKGIELLTGTAAATSLEIGLVREYDPPVTGWYALVRMPSGAFKAGELTVDPGNFELLRGKKPLSGIPYLLFSIDAAATRPDWAKIPELKASYADFSVAVKKNDKASAKEAVNTFNRLAGITPELLRTHATDVIKAVGEEYAMVFPEELGTGAKKIPHRNHDFAKELRGLAVNFSTPV